MKAEVVKSLVGYSDKVGSVGQRNVRAIRASSAFDADLRTHNGGRREASIAAATAIDATVAPSMRSAEETDRASFEEPARVCRIETLLITPSALFREGLRRILSESAYCPTASAASLEDVEFILRSDDNALLLILDAASDHAETCRQVRMLKEVNPSIRVVMLVEQYKLDQVLAAFEAGVAACFMKSISHEALVKSLDLVMLGETIFPSAIVSQLRNSAASIDDGKRKGFSAQETVILECLTEGASNKLIARKLDIAEATVKVHIKTILRKLQVKNRTQAALWASSHLCREGRDEER